MLAGHQDGEQLEQGGAEGDQGVGAQPCGALPPLPFQPDHRPSARATAARAAKYPTLAAGSEDRNPAITIPFLVDRRSRRTSLESASRPVQVASRAAAIIVRAVRAIQLALGAG